MSISTAMCRNISQALKNTPSSGPRLNVANLPWLKDNVVVVTGATGTGKSRLSIELATVFRAEIINSDKMQVYEGLDIVTNKITTEEQKKIPHHLLGTRKPDSDFTASHFRDSASLAIDSITSRGQLPIIVGGSNSYIEALIDDDEHQFRSRYDFCCLWVDVSMPVLRQYVAERVDQMLENGMVNELRPFFNPKGDYSRGIRRAIGVPEFDRYFRMEPFAAEETRRRLLEEAIREMKENTCNLACKQLAKIHRLRDVKRWRIHRLDATAVFRKRGEEANEAWKKMVAEPSAMIVADFLYNDDNANVRDGFRRSSTQGSAIATATC